MSIHYSGALRRSNGVVAAIAKQLKSVNLKAVNRITVSFNPFNENAKSTRELLVHLTSPKIIKTNPNCIVKPEVLCNLQPAEVKFSLIDPVKEQTKLKEIRFISDNLTTLELLQLCNKHITPLAPKEDVTATPLQTKSSKAAGSSRKVIKRK
ncbi:uncharacterized protein LOC129920134 [Episyrphus balteatus]|uniref:uncharacterized protein LOC129920134 n=1 Tax=Episyrphus balteatus TaxID=286459 RepID=UPI0024858A67|nr:uncharacterized protein LOC129920134 [Episyrphus balteatus]